jgi:hypothetical protein
MTTATQVAMSEVNLELLPWQQEVLADDARFKVVVAGRRCGKSHIAAVSLLINALEGEKGVTVYVAPTQGMARDILWHKLFEIAGSLITNSNINNLEMTLTGGKRLYLKGADRPDTLRGLSINHLVLDEYAFMKQDVYEAILRPALSDLKGSALFIGTPDGRNHFYDLYAGAVSGAWEGYQGWTFTTEDNPLVDKKEVQHARETLRRGPNTSTPTISTSWTSRPRATAIISLLSIWQASRTRARRRTRDATAPPSQWCLWTTMGTGTSLTLLPGSGPRARQPARFLRRWKSTGLCQSALRRAWPSRR